MITLRLFQEEDIELFKRWLKQDYVLKWYEHPDSWIKEVSEEEFSWIHHFIVECDGVAIGFCQYYDYSLGGETWHNHIVLDHTYSIDYLIGDPEYIGKGLGTKIIRILTERIFRETDAKLIIVQPEADNHASCRTLLSAGYDYDNDNALYFIKR